MHVKPSCSIYVKSMAIGLSKARHLTVALCATALLSAAQLPSAGAQTQSTDPLTVTQESFEHPVKFAIYSAAWHLSSNAGLRVVAQNIGDTSMTLGKVIFKDETGDAEDTALELNLLVPPQGWAETQIPYQNILTGNECVNRTMQDDWRLVEISNYTLNPSVRGLIIENTRSFRIYQCVRRVQTVWLDKAGEQEINQWLMYHFERLPLE